MDFGTILFWRINENQFLSKIQKIGLYVCLLIIVFSFQCQFLWYYLYVLLTMQQSLNGELLNLFIFLPIFDSICILQNAKLFPKKITFFQLNISDILLYLKLFVTVLYVISSSLCKNFRFIFVRYFIHLSWTKWAVLPFDAIHWIWFQSPFLLSFIMAGLLLIHIVKGVYIET